MEVRAIFIGELSQTVTESIKVRLWKTGKAQELF